MVHEGLEGRQCITKLKEHYGGFEESKRSNEGSLPLVFFLDANIVVAPSDVKFHEEGGILHIIDEFGDEWQGVCISDSMGV